MTKPFDMTLFLSGVLTGSKATQQRHLRQARIMQAAIQQRWQRDNPWTWQFKHVRWFFIEHLKDHAHATRYYYWLTALVIWKRRGGDSELPNSCSALGLPQLTRQIRHGDSMLLINSV
ncbi:hypothetical protein [uncultured Pseudomonas sp.]|uniref:hypothetical protein n=1 Tax=uncultured Pseudomonas sp. TaxID=114707 RepID=UPI002637299E|nr:hypothetical protein [uncultured Pseudomonas sp.]